MDNHEYMEHLCYRVNDLYEDAVKWKALMHKLPSEQERSMAKSIADMLFDQYKKMSEMLTKKYTEM